MATEAVSGSRPKFSQLLRANFERVYRCLDPSLNLFMQLTSVEYLQHPMPLIKSQPTQNQKLDALLTHLQDVPDHLEESVMNDVIAALRSSGQGHVANIFRQETDEVPMSDAHYDLISKNRIKLREFINPKDRLIDHLISSGAFTETDRSAVLSITQLDEMTDETLNILLRKPDSAFDKFMSALNETEQCHVTYMITGVSNPPMTAEHREMLRNKMPDLCKYIDAENGLLDVLYSYSVITKCDVERIRSVADYNTVARKLLESLLRKSDNAFDKFVTVLNETGQGHVVYLLTGEGDSRPVKEEHRKRMLAMNRSEIVNTLDSKTSGIITALMSRGVFSSYDEARVDSAVPDTDYKRNEIILDLIARKSQMAFFNFISALNDTDQTHVAVAMIGANVIAKLKTVYDAGNRNGNSALPNVDAELLDYIREMFEHNGIVVSRLNRILSAKGVAVTDIRDGSIQVTFTCNDDDSLQNLRNLYTSGQLQDLFVEAFCPRFAHKGLESMKLEITDEMFAQCAVTFSRWTLMTTEHRLALKSSTKWLVDTMTISADLLDKLSLCKRRRQGIVRAATREQQVKTLLDIVSRQPDSAFTQLLNALSDTQQFKAVSCIRGFLSLEKNPTENEMDFSKSNDQQDSQDDANAGSEMWRHKVRRKREDELKITIENNLLKLIFCLALVTTFLQLVSLQ